jgi:hypothetical protein
MLPLPSTRMAGVNACVSLRWLIRTGVDHVRPPSVERENATWSRWNPLKRASCHTT